VKLPLVICDLLASKLLFIYAVITAALGCIFHSTPTSASGPSWITPEGRDKIKHVVVLMLENRSFDHYLGHSEIRGRGIYDHHTVIENDSIRGVPEKLKARGVTPDMPQTMSFDPPHEFWEVKDQVPVELYDERNSTLVSDPEFVLDPDNFVKAALNSTSANSVKDLNLNPSESEIMAQSVLKGYRRDQVPVMVKLAEEFTVFDSWHADIPGPTVPNRLMLHAATSGGLVASPDPKAIFTHPFLHKNYDNALEGLKFRGGTLFHLLSANRKSWKVYNNDHLPNVALLHGMMRHLILGQHFSPFGDWLSGWNYTNGGFYNDANSDSLPAYSFIEPHYGNLSTFVGGNSQHPVGNHQDGEGLIKYVYETLRNSKSWNNTLLLIVYDEHGGFYDHVLPPRTVPTGDDEKYNNKDGEKGGHFLFDRLGIRVPVLAISPWIPKGTIDHRLYSHSSVAKTIEDWQNLPPLTERDAHAKSIGDLLLNHPRTDCVSVLPVPHTEPSNLPRATMSTAKDQMKAQGDFLFLAGRAIHTMAQLNLDANMQLNHEEMKKLEIQFNQIQDTIDQNGDHGALIFHDELKQTMDSFKNFDNLKGLPRDVKRHQKAIFKALTKELKGEARRLLQEYPNLKATNEGCGASCIEIFKNLFKKH
jgi:phospholipase C